MSQVGIRALKQNASKVVARAAAGDVITVTDHGRPVARLVPIRASRLEEMIHAGIVDPVEKSLADLPAPRAPLPGEQLPSQILQEMRDTERY